MSGLGCELTVDGATATIAGEIDHFSSPQFHPRLRAFAAQGGHLVIDLEAVTFIDSTGISALILVRQHVSAAGGSLRVLPSEIVRRVVDVLGVGDLLLP